MNTIIAFILMFGILVFIHEFGHFIFAKRAGMLVREFAIGFGPKVFAHRKNETLYTIRLLPLGGYVRVAGEDPEIIELKPGHHIGLVFNDQGKVSRIIVNNKSKHPEARVIEVERADLDHRLMIEGYDVNDEEKVSFEVDRKAFFVMDERETQIAPYDRQFSSKTIPQRAIQIFAGPMMNFLLAIAIFTLLGMLQGVPVDEAKLGEIITDGPADKAGLQQGDEILRVDDENINSWTDFVKYIEEHPGEQVDITAERNGEVFTTQVHLDSVEREGKTVGLIKAYRPFEKEPGQIILYGFVQTYQWGELIIDNVGKLITGQISIENLSGPVGIYNETDKVVQLGFYNFLHWTAFLSINLGIINLLPLPALDGGRLMFIGIEAIRGKPLDPQKEGIVHFIGFALLMLLMIVVTWNDIQRLFL